VTDIQSTIKLFADDTSLYLIVDDPNETADSLNNDLTKIHDWATKWLVTFNAQKTETMTISRKPDHPPLYMDSNDISTVSEPLFRESAVSFGSSTIRYKLVSSANSFIVDCISVTISFIKIIK
jgi:hypothetical protein